MEVFKCLIRDFVDTDKKEENKKVIERNIFCCYLVSKNSTGICQKKLELKFPIFVFFDLLPY